MDWAIHTVKPLRSFVSGHACLLGDAVRFNTFLALSQFTYVAGL